MNVTRRVVFDTGTLIGAMLCHTSPADRALTLALREGVLCASDATIDHLRSVLNNGKWEPYCSKRTRRSFVELLRGNAWYCSSPDAAAARTPGLNRRTKTLLALAVAAEADVIVTTARDLLVRKSWRKIPIVPPSEFVNWYDPA